MKNKLFEIQLMTLGACCLMSCGGRSGETYDGRPMEEVLSALTLEQKVNLVMGTRRGEAHPPEEAPGMPARHNHAAIEEISQGRIKGAAADGYSIDSLHIPSIIYADGPAGLRISPFREGTDRTFYCTAFPTGTSLAASWDVHAVEEAAAALGEEVLEYGVDILLAPALNIHRNPLCGRNFEYYSEDPFLTGEMAAAYTKGVQSRGVGVSLKHFAANNQETFRNGVDVQVSERALREIYLRGFERAVRQAAPWSIMSSYNKINGVLASENEWLLTDVLRGEWGFDGVVMTDWWAEENGARQQAAGNDLLMPGTQRQYDEILEGLKAGTLTEAQLDRNVARVLKMIEKTPTFRAYVCSNAPDLEEHARISRRQAADGMVLLENRDGTLPLKPGVRIALFGNAGYDTYAGGTGSGNVNRKYTVHIADGLSSAGFPVDRSLAARYEDYLRTEKARHEAANFWTVPEIGEMPLTESDVARAFAENDVAIVVLSRMAGEGGDRQLRAGDYYPSAAEQANLTRILRTARSTGKRVVLLFNMGGVVELDRSQLACFDAVMHLWLPGQEAGNAVADLLSGRVTPSGKLPFTWAVRYADYPSSSNFPLSAGSDRAVRYEEDIYVGYRYFDTRDVEVLYPFGYGLSYTEFEYSNLTATRVDGGIEVSLDVRNCGAYAGREVVEVYVSLPAAEADRPKKELKAFAKTEQLAPGSSCRVNLFLADEDLTLYDPAIGGWRLAEGTYTVQAAASVDDVRAAARVEVKG